MSELRKDYLIIFKNGSVKKQALTKTERARFTVSLETSGSHCDTACDSCILTPDSCHAVLPLSEVVDIVALEDVPRVTGYRPTVVNKPDSPKIGTWDWALKRLRNGDRAKRHEWDKDSTIGLNPEHGLHWTKNKRPVLVSERILSATDFQAVLKTKVEEVRFYQLAGLFDLYSMCGLALQADKIIRETDISPDQNIILGGPISLQIDRANLKIVEEKK